MKKGYSIMIIVFLMILIIILIFFINAARFHGLRTFKIPEEEIRKEINKLFSSEEKSIIIYPRTKFSIIKQGDTGEFGIGIRNLDNSDRYFSYHVSVYDMSLECEGVTKKEIVERWIKNGKSENDILIASRNSIHEKILFKIPGDAPLCIIKFKVEVMNEKETYATESFSVKIEER